MPDPETLKAVKECLEAFSKLVGVIGPWWTLLFAVLLVLGWLGFQHLRARQADQGWERVIKAKDDMIAQINEQNRELRVQALVQGGQFDKQEAARLVYGDDRLGAPGAASGTSAIVKKKP